MISLERLHEVLHYDRSTGLFTWKKALSGRGRAETKAGHKANNRIEIRIDGKLYLAHRLAWFYVTGEWPEQEIDHRNLDGTDNRFSNLRPANHSTNGANIGAHRDSLLGVKGVSFDRSRGKYVAQLVVRGKRVLCKRFDTQGEAKAAYDRAAVNHFGDYARAA